MRKKNGAEGIRLPENYSIQDRMVLAKKQKYTSVEQGISPDISHAHMVTLSLIKEARIYNGERLHLQYVVLGILDIYM